MLAVNSAKQCPYCTGLHGELARMAGVEDSLKLNGATSVEECRELVDEQAIVSRADLSDTAEVQPIIDP